MRESQSEKESEVERKERESTPHDQELGGCFCRKQLTAK